MLRRTRCLHNSIASDVRGSAKTGNVGKDKFSGHLVRGPREQNAVRNTRISVANETGLFHARSTIVGVVDDRLGSWDMGHYILLEYFILNIIWRERTKTHLKKRKWPCQSLGSKIGFGFVGPPPFRLRPVMRIPLP